MKFVFWLKEQSGRSDDIGWVSRLFFHDKSNDPVFIASANLIHKNLYKLSNYNSLIKFSDDFSGKIKYSLVKSIEEWYKLSSKPLIGIFWIVDGDIVDFSNDSSSIPVIHGFKDSKYSHVSVWDTVLKFYPHLKGKEYTEVPRGRIVGIGDSKFNLYVPPELVNDTTLLNKIIKHFNLPKSQTSVIADEHYRTLSEVSYDDFDDDFDENY